MKWILTLPFICIPLLANALFNCPCTWDIYFMNGKKVEGIITKSYFSDIDDDCKNNYQEITLYMNSQYLYEYNMKKLNDSGVMEYCTSSRPTNTRVILDRYICLTCVKQPVLVKGL